MIDLSRFQHYKNPERFDRHLRRLHDLVGTRKVITAGEQYRDPSRPRLMGQMYISNLFGLFEVEEWEDENARKAQIEWSQWILDVLHADRRNERLPKCPLGARSMLKIAIANVLSEKEPKKKRRHQRMLEGTRLETGILQTVGLQAVARTCCVRRVTSSGEDASFEGVRHEDPPAVNGDDMLDRYGSFLKHRRIGQAFDDAEVIATAVRRKKTAWGRLRRYSGLEDPKLRVADLFQEKLDLVLKRWRGQQYVPAQPSRLRQSIVLPSSTSSRGGRKTAYPRKTSPCVTLAILRRWFGADVGQAMMRADFRNLETVPPELRKLRAAVAAGGRSLYTTGPETNTSALQSTGVPASSENWVVGGGPRGTKRPLREVSPASGGAQDNIKKMRRSSVLLSSSPSAGSAEEGIIAAQAENKRRRSGLLFSSSPSTGEPQVPRPNNQPESVHLVPAQEAAQDVERLQLAGNYQAQRPLTAQTQQPVLQQPHDLAEIGTQLRPPGRQYRPQATSPQRPLGRRPQAPRGPARRPQASLQQSASVIPLVSRRFPLQVQQQLQARASTNPMPRQATIPQLAARAREDYWRRIPMVPDAAQRLQDQAAAHGRAALAETNRQYQLIHQLLMTLPAFQNSSALQVDAATKAHVIAQFRMTEAQWRVNFPTLALPQDQPLARQLSALKWILRTVNPPQRDWPEFQEYYTACCELEARVEQLFVLRGWTRQWEQTLVDARAHSAHDRS